MLPPLWAGGCRRARVICGTQLAARLSSTVMDPARGKEPAEEDLREERGGGRGFPPFLQAVGYLPAGGGAEAILSRLPARSVIISRPEGSRQTRTSPSLWTYWGGTG
jgi:hypothetical protein